jgi:hypothetical protein
MDLFDLWDGLYFLDLFRRKRPASFDPVRRPGGEKGHIRPDRLA